MRQQHAFSIHISSYKCGFFQLFICCSGTQCPVNSVPASWYLPACFLFSFGPNFCGPKHCYAKILADTKTREQWCEVCFLKVFYLNNELHSCVEWCLVQQCFQAPCLSDILSTCRRGKEWGHSREVCVWTLWKCLIMYLLKRLWKPKILPAGLALAFHILQ